MKQSEKERILVKLQELTAIVTAIKCEEATLFDKDFQAEIPESTPSAVTAPEKPNVKRIVLNDGSMTALTIANRLSKELRMDITKESVVKVGKYCGATATYSGRQHVSRYSPESVNRIMSIYRSFNQL